LKKKVHKVWNDERYLEAFHPLTNPLEEKMKGEARGKLECRKKRKSRKVHVSIILKWILEK
jgi:hypothetical protein